MRGTGGLLTKVPVEGGPPVVVRTDNARGPALARMAPALFYVVPLQNLNGSQDYELRAARPEWPFDFAGAYFRRPSANWQGLHPVISRDGNGGDALGRQPGDESLDRIHRGRKNRRITGFRRKTHSDCAPNVVIQWEMDICGGWRRRLGYRSVEWASEIRIIVACAAVVKWVKI